MAFYGNGANITGLPEPSELSTASGSAPSYSARAWVQFDGSGTLSVNSSGNVSSVTDVATGKYRVNFSTAMPNSTYAVATMTRRINSDTDLNCSRIIRARSTTSCEMHTGYPSGGSSGQDDSQDCSFMAIG